MEEILQSSSPKKDYYKVIIILLWVEACAQRPDWPIDASNTWDTMKLQPVGRVIQWLSQSVINLWVSEWGCWYYTSKNPLNRPTLAIRFRLILWQEFLRHTYTTKNKLERGQDFYLLDQNISWQKLGFQNLCLYVLVGQFIVLKRGPPPSLYLPTYLDPGLWSIEHRGTDTGGIQV